MEAAGPAERWLADEAGSDTDEAVSMGTEEAAAAMLGGYLSEEEASPPATSPAPAPAAHSPHQDTSPRVVEVFNTSAYRPAPARESLTDRIVAARRAAGQRTGPQRPRRRCPDPVSRPHSATMRSGPRFSDAAADNAHVMSLAALPPRQAMSEQHPEATSVRPEFCDVAPFPEEEMAGMMQWEGLGCAGIR